MAEVISTTQQVQSVDTMQDTVQEEKKQAQEMSLLQEKLGVTIDRENLRICKEIDHKGKLTVGLDESHGIVTTATQIIEKGVPTNKDIKASVDEWKSFINSRSEGLNQQGKKLLGDAHSLLDSLQRVIETKNKDDIWKQFSEDLDVLRKDVVEISTKETQELQQINTDELKTQIKNDSKEFIDNIQSLVMSLVKSGEFRTLLLDMVLLMQSLVRNFDKEYADRIEQTLRVELVEKDTMDRTNITTLGRDIVQSAPKKIVDEQELKKIEDELTSIIQTVTSKPHYSDNIKKLFSLVEKLEHLLETKQNSLKEYEKEKRNNYKKVINSATVIVAQFTGQEEVTVLKNKVSRLFKMIAKDQVVRQYLKDLKEFIIESAQNPVVVAEQQPTLRQEQIKMFVTRGRAAFNDNRQQYDDLLGEIKQSATKILENMKRDDSTKEIRENLVKLIKDSVTDEQGKPDLFVLQESVLQMKQLMTQLVTEQITNLPLPIVELDNDKYSISLQNMVLDASGILPQHVHIESINKMDMNANKDRSVIETQLKFNVECIKMELKNVNYTFKHKKAPKINDAGVIDIKIAGAKGFSISMDWGMLIDNQSDRKLEFKLNKLNCNISKLKIKVRKASHRLAHQMLVNLLKGYIKKQIVKAIEAQIRTVVGKVHSRLNTITDKTSEKLKNALNKEKAKEQMERMNTQLRANYEKLPNPEEITLEQLKQKVKAQVAETKTKVTNTVKALVDGKKEDEVLVVDSATVIVEEKQLETQMDVQATTDAQTPMTHPNVLPVATSSS